MEKSFEFVKWYENDLRYIANLSYSFQTAPRNSFIET